MDRLIMRNDQWERIEAQLPAKTGDPGRTGANNRHFVEGVLWIDRTGSPWRDLPTLLGNWNCVYQRFNRWSIKGVWNHFKEFASDDPDFRDYSLMVLSSEFASMQQEPKKRKASKLPESQEAVGRQKSMQGLTLMEIHCEYF